MDLRVDEFLNQQSHRVVRMRCPACRHKARLEPLFTPADQTLVLKSGMEVGVGSRMCPDEACAQMIFVVYELGDRDSFERLLYSAPAETLDFDTSSLPERVLNSMTEAASCFSNGCYIAAAIMIRKTLEEVCHDRGATGPNLKERIQRLGQSVILPAELLDGLDSLRLLGNDAAHLESQTFTQVGRDEVEISFDVAKEVLKSVYQYRDLIGRLDAFKREQVEG